MGIMDSASYYLGRGIDSADKATRGLKIQAEITRLESQKKDLIQQLGQVVYERSKSNDGVRSIFLQECASVSEVEERMAAFRRQLAELQGGSRGSNGGEHGVACPKCGTVNSTDFAFCVGCGAKMPTESVTEGDWICTACGSRTYAIYGRDTQFCMQCGSLAKCRDEQVSDQGSIKPKPVDPEDAVVKTVKEPAVCPACGVPVEADDVFCGECGRAI